MRILHLSDLHFGFDKEQTQIDLRKNYLNSLRSKIREGVSNTPIQYIAITGDFAWAGGKEDFDAAKTFVEGILKDAGLNATRLLICPGNHDLDRGLLFDKQFPEKQKEANEFLKLERLAELSRAFENYMDFCTQLGVEKFKIHDNENYLVGARSTPEFNVVCINTAWYAKGDTFQNKMWIGSNLIDSIIASDVIDTTKPTITIMHHPMTCWNEAERSNYPDQKNTFHLLKSISNMILCGHTHEILNDPISFENGFIFATGASYVQAMYQHNFHIYEMEDIKSIRSVERYFFSYNGREWRGPERQTYTHSRFVGVPPQKNIQAQSIEELFSRVGIEPYNINSQDLSLPGTIIWPVVPRQTVTLIHQAQIELMSLMSKKFSWRVKVIVSNCGTTAERYQAGLKEFLRKTIQCMTDRGISGPEIMLLSDYFDAKRDYASSVLENFIAVCKDITKINLEKLKNKQYDDSVRARLDQLPMLDYILPSLQLAVVSYLAATNQHAAGESQKALIISGKDEKDQWGYIIRGNSNHTLGALFIPTLKDSKDNDSWQQGITHYMSADELLSDLAKGNLGFWAYNMFIKLRAENGSQSAYMLDAETYNRWGQDEYALLDTIDKGKLSRAIWDVLKQVI